MQFILQTGFSTAAEVTQISGRGVGMDVVNSEVKQLGGSLHIESTAGLGTIFTVRLPYTLAINQALLVTAGEQTFCVPLGSVEGVVRANWKNWCHVTVLKSVSMFMRGTSTSSSIWEPCWIPLRLDRVIAGAGAGTAGTYW